MIGNIVGERLRGDINVIPLQLTDETIVTVHDKKANLIAKGVLRIIDDYSSIELMPRTDSFTGKPMEVMPGQAANGGPKPHEIPWSHFTGENPQAIIIGLEPSRH